jgi:hypothetical protein
MASLVDQVAPHDLAVRDLNRIGASGGDPNGFVVCGENLAANLLARGRLQPDAAPDRPREVLGLAQGTLEARRGDVDRVVAPVLVELVRDALAERVVDAAGVVDVDAEAVRTEQLDGEHLRARHAFLDLLGELLRQLPLLRVGVQKPPLQQKWAPHAPISPTR